MIALFSLSALATVPAEDDRPLPAALRRDARGDFTVRNGFIPATVEAQANRLAIDSLLSFKIGPGPVRVSGVRQVPVIPFRYKNTTSPAPIDLTKLQNELFGQWDSGSLTDFYLENSYGAFTLTGIVGKWRQVALKDADYEGQNVAGGEPCNGLCSTAKLRQLFQEAIALDPTFDWARFDSDGNGLVDFVTFVQPERGGECPGSTNIWSHQGNFDDRGGPIPTASRGADGGVISINDYVIVPALACNSSTMIQIGVFAHEFGHVFGLPDLYDTDKAEQGASAGLGNWCLMSGGYTGGVGGTPERPVHMSPWAKEQLGWVHVEDAQEGVITLSDYRLSGRVVRIALSPTQSYLLSNLQQQGFNATFPGAGLAVWEINEAVINASWSSNLVNANSSRRGVSLVEASAEGLMDDPKYKGSAADLFPGSEGRKKLDEAGAPKAAGPLALCGIPDASAEISFRFYEEVHRCPEELRLSLRPLSAIELIRPFVPRVERVRTKLATLGASPRTFGSRVVLVRGRLTRTAEGLQLVDGAKKIALAPFANADESLQREVELLVVNIDRTGKKPRFQVLNWRVP